MRTIQIDTDVFAKLWALRAGGEEDENSILRRVLGVSAERARPTTEQAAPQEIRIPQASKVLWRDDVRTALQQLGGQGHLGDIYEQIRSIRRAEGRSLPRELEAIVRRELENNSSDAGAYTGHRDWFRSVDGLGKGRWALNDQSK